MDEDSKDFRAQSDLDTLLEAKRIREDQERVERVRQLLKQQRSVVPRRKRDR